MFQLKSDPVDVLDVGCGTGVLSEAMAIYLRGAGFEQAGLYGLDNDESVRAKYLSRVQKASNEWGSNHSFKCLFNHADFLTQRPEPRFDFVIMNPPFGKFPSSDPRNQVLREHGFIATNIYAAFVMLGVEWLTPGGQLVAITPRSFCAGPYFSEFRKYLYENTYFGHFRVLDSRSEEFAKDGVLQELVVLRLIKKGPDVKPRQAAKWHGLERHGEDWVATSRSVITAPSTKPLPEFKDSILDWGCSVTVGKCVKFRVQKSLRNEPGPHTYPFITTNNFWGTKLRWPSQKKDQPSYISDSTKKYLYPNNRYVLVKRISSKEETRRLKAYIYEPEQLPGTDFVCFDTSLLIIAGVDKELTPDEAKHIYAYLLSDEAERYIRATSGTIHINVSDLKRLPFPSRSETQLLF